jgi:hypothetical protein
MSNNVLINNKPTYKRHPDDEWWDEIRITTVPRYKTSGLSGDEWRVSARIEIFRKGVLLKERHFSKIQYAVATLPAMLLEMSDEGSTNHEDFDRLCFQPGCKEEGVVELRLKDEYYPCYGDKMPKREWAEDGRRRFCEKHSRRGDCGLEDSDANYELVSAPPGWEGNAALGAIEAASPAKVVTVRVDSPEDLHAAIEQVRKGGR